MANVVSIQTDLCLNVREREGEAMKKLWRTHKMGSSTQQNDFCTKSKWQLIVRFHGPITAQMPETKKLSLSIFSLSIGKELVSSINTCNPALPRMHVLSEREVLIAVLITT
jgi:hypothetical protein